MPFITGVARFLPRLPVNPYLPDMSLRHVHIEPRLLGDANRRLHGRVIRCEVRLFGAMHTQRT